MEAAGSASTTLIRNAQVLFDLAPFEGKLDPDHVCTRPLLSLDITADVLLILGID